MAMQREKNMNLLRRLFDELLVKRDLSRYADFVAEDVQAHCPLSWKDIHDNEVKGSSNTHEIDNAYAQAFKITSAIIHDIFACDSSAEKIAVRWTCTGTHSGDYFYLKASHKPIHESGISIYRFNAEGKIAEVWQSWDMLGLLQQIGALPRLK